MPSSKIHRGYLALIIANILLGISIPIFKYVIGFLPIFTYLFIRFFTSGLLFAPFALSKGIRVTGREFILLIIGGILGITIHVGAAFLGLEKTESINLPLIFSAGPVFVYFLSVRYLREKPNSRILGGMLISLIGVLIIILSPLLTVGKSIDFTKIEGNFLILLALFADTVSVLIKKQTLSRISPVVVMFYISFFGSLGFIPPMLGELRGFSFSSLNWIGWFGIVYGILAVGIVANYLFTYGLSKINAEEVGIFSYIDPIATVLVAIPLLGEIPSLDFYLGALLVFGGIFIAERRFHWHPLHKLRVKG